MWICSYCGRENGDEWPACPQCGKEPEVPAVSKAAPTRVALRAVKPDVFAQPHGVTRNERSTTEQGQTDQAREQADAWNQMILEWLAHIGQESGGTFKISESEHFFMLSAFSPDGAAAALRSAESALKTLRAVLGRAACMRFLGKHALIVLRDQNEYDRYIAEFDPDETPPERVASIGPQEYTHISLAGTGERLDLWILANELSHNLLAHLRLPRWLTEGLSSVLTRHVTRQAFTFDPDAAPEHRQIWNETTIQAFWSGQAFDSPELAAVAYSLADILVTLLAGKGIELIDFITAANREDAGESAALIDLGFSLADVAAEFLGPGQWRPRANVAGKQD
jgi:hypothetical protein